MDVAFLGGVQIDQFGSLNMSIIGSDPHRPKVRLPGGAGGPLMIRSFRRVISWRPNHSQKNLVKELPFITSPGWVPVAKGSRHGGPDKIVTDLCVFQFDRSSKQISLQSVHPGVKVTDVQEKTGFQFKIPRKIEETAAPSKREIEILSSQIDPESIRKTLVSPPK
jgi:glutaconate CoA-transferase subunit B